MSAFSKSLLGGAGRICACFSWFLAAMISGNPVLAQTQTLRPLIVTASRLPMRVDQSLADVTVIEREDIERSGQRTLAELLATQPGVQVTSYGGGLSSVFLRGMESRHTLLLVDGVRYGSATTGAPTLDNLPLEFIDRIEIVRGPVSGLYGSDAVGGVIQIFTRQGQQGARPYGQIAIGSNRYSQVSAGLFHAQGAWDTAVQVQHTETKGISATNAHVPWGVFNADRDGFRQNSLSARLGLKLGEGWRADSTLMRSDGVTGFDEGPDSDSRSRLVSEILSFSLQGKMSANWTSTMRWARSKDGFDVVSNDGSYPLGNTGTVQTQLSWENQVDSPLGVWLLLAESLQQEVSRPGAAYEVSRRTIHGLSVGLEGQQGPHGWQANIRQDENSQFGAQTNGTVGYGYQWNPSWRIRAAAGTSFVAPSFNQLYYPLYGNPHLLPEQGQHRELGVHWGPASGHEFKWALFETRMRHFISAGPSPQNVPYTRTNGLSLFYGWRKGDWILTSALEHVNPRNQTPGANDGKLLPRRSQNSFKVSSDRVAGAWRWGADLTAFGPRFDDPANQVRLGGFGTLDLRADWHVAPRWTVGTRLSNTLNKRYETNYGYNPLGRTAYLTLRYSGD